MKYDGIIFDWAGTTVDYGCITPVKAFDEAFKAFGIAPTMEEIRKPMGMLKIDHVRTMLSMPRIHDLWKKEHGADWTEADVQKVYELSEKKIFEVLDKYTDVKPYVVETVKALRDMGLKIGSTTGYTSDMMAIVTKAAAAQGYAPDSWFSPDLVGGKGRPYPYMVFANMEKLGLGDVRRVLKVGDTVSDIKEGQHAGLDTVGIIEGSSLAGLSKEEYDALTPAQQEEVNAKTAATYKEIGTTYIVKDIRGLLDIVK